MLCNKIREKFYTNQITKNIPVIYTTMAITTFEEILEEIKEENPYANISELLDE